MKKGYSTLLVSVIVPVYNIESYVGKCIESIIAQTYENLEIILVDDGSTDNSGQICDNYAKMDSRIKVIHKVNGGLVSARKAGILEASGDYAAYVDGDDWIEKDMYECLLSQIGDADVIVSGVARDYEAETHSICEKNKLRSGIYEGISLQKIYRSMIYTGQFFERGISQTIWKALYKKELLLDNQMRVPNEIRVGEDAACIYPVLLNADKIVLTDKVFYHYVMRADSIMGTRDSKELDRYRSLYKYLKSRFCEVPENQEELILQLDYLMLYYLLLKEVRILQYKDNKVFPYANIPYDSKVIVYGKGRFGKEFVEYLKESEVLSVVLWIDSDTEDKMKEFISSEDYDFVIVSVLIEEMAREIELKILEMGVEKRKIKRIDSAQIEIGRKKVETLLSTSHP